MRLMAASAQPNQSMMDRTSAGVGSNPSNTAVPVMNRFAPEIIGMIAGQLDTPSLRSLRRVSRQMNAAATPHFYTSVSFTFRTTEGLTSAIRSIPLDAVKYVKHLAVVTPPMEFSQNSCPHETFDEPMIMEPDGQGPRLVIHPTRGPIRIQTWTFNPSNDIETPPGPNFFDVLPPVFESFLGNLPDNSLKSFSWTLGSCIPRNLLGGEDSKSCALGKQKMIETITLVTDSSCGDTPNTSYLVDLVQFPKLRCLSWTGFSRFEDLESVRRYIEANGEKLESLSLDPVDWISARNTFWDGARESNFEPHGLSNFLAEELLSLRSGERKELLPSLKHLSLSEVSFGHLGAEMAFAFNFARLRSLELNNCNARGLFRSIAESGISIALTSFKTSLGWDPGSATQGAEPITVLLARFLNSFKGLEKLSLRLPYQSNWDQIHRGALNHASTLKRVIFHHRGKQDYMHDTGGGDIPWTNDLDQLSRSRSLTGIGLSASSPAVLASELRRIWPRPAWKVLHIRSTADQTLAPLNLDFHSADGRTLSKLATASLSDPSSQTFAQLADWAFSFDGLPNLQILAFGDFSRGGRFASQNIIVRRDHSRYIPLYEGDAYFGQIVENYMDMLSA